MRKLSLLTYIIIFISTLTFAADNQPILLKVIQKPLQVNNKTSQVFDIVQENGTQGLHYTKGDNFNVLLKNETNAPVSIHWHGLILPNDQDGVAFITQMPIPPGKTYRYHFPLVQAGTYWMHSHYKLDEQQLMAAPLIIDDPKELYPDYKSIVVMLQDFSFKTPEQIFTGLKKSAKQMKAMDHMNMDMDMNNKMNMSDHSKMQMSMKQDLNDVDYDAYLANRRTLAQPEIYKVTPGEKIRLRIINASAATNYWINTGDLEGTLIAVDGQYIKPIKNHAFQIAIAQRLDILVTIPTQQKTYPILAQIEGTKRQSGILLVTPEAKLISPPILATKNATAIDDTQEKQLHALEPITKRPITNTLTYTLEGNMQDYVWTINKEVWPHVKPLKIKKGDRVEMIFKNTTDMSHPMHLHGHVFQVASIDGKTLENGPMHDTILVLPHSTKTIIFDAENPGIWPMHCHVLYHMEAGMMTTTNYENYPEPDFYKALLNGSLVE